MFLVGALVVVVSVLLTAFIAAQHGSASRRMDGPGLLLAAAVRRLPDDRVDWGAAMLAELAELRIAPERWRFALGCARVALFPAPGRTPALVTLVFTAVAAVFAGVVVGRVLPGMQVFAIAFTALVGALATLAVARSRRPVLAPASLGIATGVAACVAATAYVAAVQPAGARGPLRDLSLVLAVLLAGYLWLALTPPRALLANRCARRLGTAAGLLVGLDLALVSMVDYDFDHAVVPYAWLGALAVLLACSGAAATIARSRRAGVLTALWAGLISTPIFLAVELSAALNRFRTGDPRFLDDFSYQKGIPLDAFVAGQVGEMLSSSVVLLALFPACALLLGLIAGAVGRATGRALDRPEVNSRQVRSISI